MKLQIVMTWPTYEMDDDGAHGVRIAGNDQFTICASNAYRRYVITFAPYNDLDTCVISYLMPSSYVYSLDVLNEKHTENSSTLYKFIQVDEDMVSQNIYFLRMEISVSESSSSCGNITENNSINSYNSFEQGRL